VKLNEFLEERQDVLYSYGYNQQPTIAVIGSPEEPEQYLVVVDGFFYDVPSIMKAVDVAFKSFFALRVHYPPESRHIWLFLQKYVYKLSTKDDPKIGGTLDIGTKYKNFCAERSRKW